MARASISPRLVGLLCLMALGSYLLHHFHAATFRRSPYSLHSSEASGLAWQLIHGFVAVWNLTNMSVCADYPESAGRTITFRAIPLNLTASLNIMMLSDNYMLKAGRVAVPVDSPVLTHHYNHDLNALWCFQISDKPTSTCRSNNSSSIACIRSLSELHAGPLLDFRPQRSCSPSGETVRWQLTSECEHKLTWHYDTPICWDVDSLFKRSVEQHLSCQKVFSCTNQLWNDFPPEAWVVPELRRFLRDMWICNGYSSLDPFSRTLTINISSPPTNLTNYGIAQTSKSCHIDLYPAPLHTLWFCSYNMMYSHLSALEHQGLRCTYAVPTVFSAPGLRLHLKHQLNSYSKLKR